MNKCCKCGKPQARWGTLDRDLPLGSYQPGETLVHGVAAACPDLCDVDMSVYSKIGDTLVSPGIPQKAAEAALNLCVVSV